MTAASVVASCAVGHAECTDTSSIDLTSTVVVITLVIATVVVTGVLLLVQRRGRR